VFESALKSYHARKLSIKYLIACEQALRGILVAGQEKEEEKSTSNSPVALHQLSCEISNHEREAEMSENVSKH